MLLSQQQEQLLIGRCLGSYQPTARPTARQGRLMKERLTSVPMDLDLDLNEVENLANGTEARSSRFNPRLQPRARPVSDDARLVGNPHPADTHRPSSTAPPAPPFLLLPAQRLCLCPNPPSSH